MTVVTLPCPPSRRRRPSSACRRRPSPRLFAQQSSLRLASSPSRQAASLPAAWIFTHVQVLATVQVAEHPSPFFVFPSSRASGGHAMPLPQAGACSPLAAIAGDDVTVVALLLRVETPSPQAPPCSGARQKKPRTTTAIAADELPRAWCAPFCPANGGVHDRECGTLGAGYYGDKGAVKKKSPATRRVRTRNGSTTLGEVLSTHRRYRRQHMMDEVCGALRISSSAAARTDSATLRGERNETLGAAVSARSARSCGSRRRRSECRARLLLNERGETMVITFDGPVQERRQSAAGRCGARRCALRRADGRARRTVPRRKPHNGVMLERRRPRVCEYRDLTRRTLGEYRVARRLLDAATVPRGMEVKPCANPRAKLDQSTRMNSGPRGIEQAFEAQRKSAQSMEVANRWMPNRCPNVPQKAAKGGKNSNRFEVITHRALPCPATHASTLITESARPVTTSARQHPSGNDAAASRTTAAPARPPRSLVA